MYLNRLSTSDSDISATGYGLRAADYGLRTTDTAWGLSAWTLQLNGSAAHRHLRGSQHFVADLVTAPDHASHAILLLG